MIRLKIKLENFMSEGVQQLPRAFLSTKGFKMKKYFGILFMSCALLTSVSLSADLSQPFASIRNLPQTPYFVQDAYVYYSLISARASAVIIDVESQDGGVARYLAQEVTNLPTITQIYSVNAWQSPDRSQKYLFQRFLSNVIQDNTAQWITPIRMTSQEAAEGLNVNADFISLVGGNDQQGIYNDILAWYPHLTDIGVMCGNNWNDTSVQIGVTRAASVLDLTVQLNGNVWYFEKGM
jgi:hypothetical protein